MRKPFPPNPPMARLGIPRFQDEDTLYPSRWVVLWCKLRFRHKGEVGIDRQGIYWQCDNCTHRIH